MFGRLHCILAASIARFCGTGILFVIFFSKSFVLFQL
jgi:hypothetical protein